jgi:hypothetical protein
MKGLVLGQLLVEDLLDPSCERGLELGVVLVVRLLVALDVHPQL